MGGAAAGVAPDILVTGKGLSGGIYPIAATLLNQRAGAWLEDDGWSNVSTFGGAELGCRVARAVLGHHDPAGDRRPGRLLTDSSPAAWPRSRRDTREWLVEVRQTGLVIGLRFAHPQGGMLMTRACYDAGVWAMFAGFDRSVLQVKPGLLMGGEEAAEVLARLDRAMAGAVAGRAPAGAGRPARRAARRADAGGAPVRDSPPAGRPQTRPPPR